MRDDQEKGAEALVTLGTRDLMAKPAQLASRGLEDLRKMESKVARIAPPLRQGKVRPPVPPDSEAKAEEFTARSELDQYREIVFAFSDLMSVHSPIIGDCAFLPHPKATILHAIKFVVDDYETKRELATDPTLIESYDRMIPTLNYLFTCLARDWHDIAPEDKDAIAKLAAYDSFPDWALPLKRKYINDERASIEAADAAFRVLKDKVDREPAIDQPDTRASDDSSESKKILALADALESRSSHPRVQQAARRLRNYGRKFSGPR